MWFICQQISVLSNLQSYNNVKKKIQKFDSNNEFVTK